MFDKTDRLQTSSGSDSRISKLLTARGIAQQRPGAPQPALDALASEIERGGDLIDRYFLDIAQQHHFAIVFGQQTRIARDRSSRSSS